MRRGRVVLDMPAEDVRKDPSVLEDTYLTG